MEIVSIFADRLTAFRYEKTQPDEFTRLFSQWQDPEYLFGFFTEHAGDLQGGFFGRVSVPTAVRQTRDEARRLESELLRLAHQRLDQVFRPLSPNEATEFTRSKATGHQPRSWLRVYAMRIEANAYVVTGGAIKLTERMQDRDHTSVELRKFERCRDYLRELGITDIDGLSELIL
jgi:hypothetical protein